MGFDEQDVPVVTDEATPEEDAALAVGSGEFAAELDPDVPVDDDAELADAGVEHEASLEDIAAAGQADNDALGDDAPKEDAQ